MRVELLMFCNTSPIHTRCICFATLVDAFSLFHVFLHFFVGEGMGAGFGVVRDEGIALVVLRHVCFFAVEVSACVVVAAVWAGLVAGGVGCPEVGVYVGGELAAKG